MIHRISIAAVLGMTFATIASGAELFSTNSTWKLLKGRTEASSPDLTAWRLLAFNDAAFTNTPAPFTYGEGYTYGTLLNDMLNQYTCIFLRRTFTLTNVAEIAALRFGAKIDDGFVAWINGVEVLRVNMPEPAGTPVTITNLSSGAPSEPVPFDFYTLPLPPSYLVNGTNLFAVQVFNVSAPSTDLVFDCAVESLLLETNPPAVFSRDPSPGAVLTNLTQISVTFTEPVSGVSADDLVLNSISATGVSGSGSNYTFTFPQPLYGLVAITWATNHEIADLAISPNPFDGGAPAATWQYTLLDTVPPTVTTLFPAPATLVHVLGQIEVTFSEDVTGVEASDLLVNGQPATNVMARPGALYVFQFSQQPAGTVNVAWAAGHGITDLAVPGNAFAGGAWTYQVDPNAQIGDLVINEVLAANQSGLRDSSATPEDPDPIDWIEIYNRSANAINLAGWSLSDDPDNPGQWVFPSKVIGPGQYLIVFASGLDIKSPPGTNRFHTNFKLADTGEFLGLYSADSPRVLVSGFSPDYPEQRNDTSYGYDAQGQLRYFATPSPGAPNGNSTVNGVVAPVHFSVTRGYYAQPFTLYLTTSTPGATIRYTTNGAAPTATNGQFYLGPLRVTNTTLLRAAAFRTNLLPSRVTTHSYLFNLSAPLRSLPVISLVTDQANLTGPRGIIGISNVVQQGDGTYVPANANGYHNPSKHGLAWEKPTSVEWIQPGDNAGFQIDAGIRVQGSDYQRPRTTPSSKFSFRLYFRGDYGPGRLEYPLFPLTTVQSFNQLVLRAGFNENNNPFIRDELVRRLSHDMGTVASHGNLAVVLVNGVPFSSSPFYNPCERVHEEFLQAHVGGGGEWDVVGPTFAQSAGAAGVIDGDRANFQNLVNYVRTQPTTNSAVYQTIGQRLDLVNFVDYCLLNAYTAMGDWPQNNWRAGKDRSSTNAPWRFIVWDAEWGMGIYSRTASIDMFAAGGGGPDLGGLSSINDSEIAQMYQRLILNREFRLLWADRIHKHFFNGGALTGPNVTNRLNELRPQLQAFFAISDAKLLGWARDRLPVIMSQFNTYGLYGYSNAAYRVYASSNAPAFNQHGGRVLAGFALTMTSPLGGTIYFTTNGGDPRVMFTGAVASNAVEFTGPVSLSQGLTVRARTLNGTNWSALAEATFQVAALGIPLRITEIHYNPTNSNAGEFIELQNVGTTTLDLSGFSFDGVTYLFPEGTMLAAGAKLVLASDADPLGFAARNPGVVVRGYYAGSLNNGGERLVLKDRNGNIITSLDYDDAAGWPTAADGSGYSLEILDPSADPDDPANWRASSQLGGTPGTTPASPPPAAVRLNEIMAENFSAVSNGSTYPDWVELYNASGSAVNLAGWSLTDDGDARKFVFPPNTMLPAGNYLVVWCDAATNTTPGWHTGFALGRNGDNVFLYDANTNRADAVSFGLQLTNSTVGQVAGEWVLTTPTPGALNLAAALDSATNLVINEWLANPPAGQEDWIELYNRSATLPVALRGLYLGTSNALHRIASLSFAAPGAFVQLFADEGVGPDHLDFKLPASGGAIVLADALAVQLDRVTYGAQAEGVSRGRLADGATNVVNFPGTASPAASNYASTYAGPVLNEVLARNQSAVTNAGRVVDYVELYNGNPIAFNLAGMSLSVNAPEAGQWMFPPSASLAAGDYLVIWCDGTRPASALSGDFNTGRALEGESGGVYLFNAAGQLVNAVEYGFQVADRSIGLSGSQWRLLATPTPGATNSSPAALGSNSVLRLNEWMANPAGGSDWFEVFNPTNLPVDLSNLVLTDDPSTAGTNLFRVAPLSFIAPVGFVQWVADADAGQGRNHVSFDLDAQGESLRLYGSSGTNAIDSVFFGAQRRGVSQGRLLDGATNIVSFVGSATPGAANYRRMPNVVINELLTHAAEPLEDAVELHNPSTEPALIGGWFLSDSQTNFKKYRIPDGTVIAPGGFAVIYEYQFNTGGPNSFSLNASQGGEVWLSAADAAGNLTGDRAGAKFAAALAGVSFGRYPTTVGVDYPALSALSFGTSVMASDPPGLLSVFRTGTGAANSAPRIGPVVINEILYNTTNDDEYIELRNVTGAGVPLYDPAHTANTWRLRGGIDFVFPPNVTLPANGYLLVANFNPADAAALAAFRTRYSVPMNVTVYGPYSGRLDNGGDTVELFQPDAPDAGAVPLVLADQVNYSDEAPWPAGAVDGGGLSLQRRNDAAYGNDPVSWVASAPTAGAANGSGVVAPPLITLSPQSQSVFVNTSVSFQASANGPGPLSYQWRFDGLDLLGETNAMLVMDFVQLENDGRYDLFVSNPGGSTLSGSARLEVRAPAIILVPPQSQSIGGGSNVIFSVTAAGSPPLRYQWRFNGSDILGANGSSLLVTNVGLEHSGTYSVLVSNSVNSVEVSATLLVRVRPTITVQPISLAVVSNSTAAFTIAGVGTTPINFRWRKNNITFTNALFVITPSNSTLILTNVTSSDVATYNVAVTNIAGQASGLSANAALTLLDDTDGDGIPDNLEPLDGAADTDGDGMTNADEFLAGTDYLDPTSYLRVEIAATGSVAISFIAMANRTYTVEYTDGLSPRQWRKLGDVLGGANTRTEVLLDPGLSFNRYYRLTTPIHP